MELGERKKSVSSDVKGRASLQVGVVIPVLVNILLWRLC